MNNKITRYIAEYTNQTDELVAKYPLKSFDLEEFQEEFGIVNPENQMLDRYPIFESSLLLLNAHLANPVQWKFVSHSYYLEAQKTA